MGRKETRGEARVLAHGVKATALRRVSVPKGLRSKHLRLYMIYSRI